jgi:hypothetical protein
MPIRNRPRLVASAPSSTKLFVDDSREVAALTRSENKSRSDVIRELVHEALRQRRLRAIGRDEGEDYVRRIHREAVAEGVNPLMNAIAELRQLVEHFSTGSRHEAQSLNQALFDLLAQLLQRAIVTENILKVLMTVGMQKDGVSPEEIRKQIAGHNETGSRQAGELMKRFLGERRSSALAE